MKIVFTVATYYPLTDGVQQVTQYLAEGLVVQGHDVTVVTSNHNEDKNKENEMHNGVKIIRCNIWTLHGIHHGNKDKYRNLIEDITKNADCMINVCTQTATTEILFPILKKIKCKKILYMHGMHDFTWNKMNLTSFSSVLRKVWEDLRWKCDYVFNKKIFLDYDNIIQLHSFDKANIYFKKHYGIQSIIVENAAANEFFDNLRDFSDKNYAVCVSNYEHRKNQEFVLRAFYKAKTKNMRLILIGSRKTEYYKKLVKEKEKLDRKFGLKNVKILYNIPRNEISKYVKESKMFLMGSKWEAFPISITEAMAAKIPFISTNVGIVKYLPGGEIVNSEDEMSYWIDMLSENETFRRLTGKIGQNFANERLSINKKVEQLNEILKD